MKKNFFTCSFLWTHYERPFIIPRTDLNARSHFKRMSENANAAHFFHIERERNAVQFFRERLRLCSAPDDELECCSHMCVIKRRRSGDRVELSRAQPQGKDFKKLRVGGYENVLKNLINSIFSQIFPCHCQTSNFPRSIDPLDPSREMRSEIPHLLACGTAPIIFLSPNGEQNCCPRLIHSKLNCQAGEDPSEGPLSQK